MSRLYKNQQGLVSFFVVTVIMIVLTLIVLAFAQLVRREQRQTLDRQLKAQAVYAAESAINDAIAWLAETDRASWNLDPIKNDCSGFIDRLESNEDLPPMLDPEGVSAYSCLLVDATPDILTYNVPTDRSALVALQPDSGSVDRLEVSWSSLSGSDTSACATGANGFPGNGTKNNDGSGCDIGTLRLEIVEFNDGDQTTRSQLINERFIGYARPHRTNTSTESVAWISGTGRDQGEATITGCNSGQCTLSITGVPSITRGYMRISSIYRDSRVTVQAFDGAPLSMDGAQVEIDATGRAGDVLHRVRANVPYSSIGDGPAPEYALQTRRTICKQFEVDGSGVNVPLSEDLCDPTTE